MARLWFFNPWNDLALGAGSLFYTPPPSARNLAEAAAMLPAWIASPDDFVLVPERQHTWALATARKYSTARPWAGEPVDECVPWGWSAATVNCLKARGVNPSALPCAEYVDLVRRLSHRRLSVEAHRALATGLEPAECHTLRQCAEALHRFGAVVGKYPWSSTGRGLFSGDRAHEESFLRRCAGAINHQGSVMIEKALDRAVDFAMLFYSDGAGTVSFRDYSLFTTNNRAYTANILLPHHHTEAFLGRYVSLGQLRATSAALERFLASRLGWLYRGWIGVDMMVYCDADGALALNPCVEINLRLTMGVLASALARRFLRPDFKGKLFARETDTITNTSAIGAATASEPVIALRLTPPSESPAFIVAEDKNLLTCD